MHDNIAAIQALQECMVFLGLASNQMAQPFHCRVVEVNGKRVFGTSQGHFEVDLHSHSGPSICFDETIRGFGIQHEKFVPRYQAFEFEEKDGDGYLTIRNASPSYSFVIKF